MNRWILPLALIAAGLASLMLVLGGDGGAKRPQILQRPGVQPEPEVERPQPSASTPATLRPGNTRREASVVDLGPIELTVLREDGAVVPHTRVIFLDLAREKDWGMSWDEPGEREAYMRRHGTQSTTDGEGRTLLPATRHGAAICSEGGLTGFVEWTEPVEGAELKLVLLKERSLKVIVVDHRGRPQPGVRVGLVRELDGQRMTLLTRQTIQGGHATFGLVSRVLGGHVGGGARFYATFAFPCEDPPKVLLDPANLPTEPVILEMPLVGVLEVRVLDERGRPLKEVANVSLGRMIPTRQGKRVFHPEHNERLMTGTATFMHVGVGTRVAIKLSGSRERADLIEEHDGPKRSGEVHRLSMRWTERYPVLLGTAVSDSGQVLKGFRGRYMVWSGERGSGGPPLTTGADGSFRLVVATTLTAEPGRYAELELYAKGTFEPQFARIDLGGALLAGETELGTVTFKKKPTLVTGIVRNAAGEGLTGVHVRVMIEEGGDRRSTSMAATSLVGGAFTIYGDVDGEFQLVVVRRGYKTVEADRLMPGTEGLELVMMPDLPQASSDGR